MKLDNITDKEILNFALDNGIIDIDTLKEKIEMNERKKYLKMHKNKIWQPQNGKWNTYVDD